MGKCFKDGSTISDYSSFKEIIQGIGCLWTHKGKYGSRETRKSLLVKNQSFLVTVGNKEWGLASEAEGLSRGR